MILLCGLAGCSLGNNRENSLDKDKEIECISDSGPSNDQDNNEVLDSINPQEENTQEELGPTSEEENVINIWSLMGDFTSVIKCFYKIPS